MLNGPWHIFHFVGHGGFDDRRDEGLIALADAEGNAQFYSASEFSNLLADHQSLRLVLLNACEGARGGARDVFSSTAATLVRRGLPAVVAMQYAITDKAAIEFAQTFYERLATGQPVDAAVAEARKAILFELRNTLEWGTPVLYLRAQDGRIFAYEQAPEPKRIEKVAESPIFLRQWKALAVALFLILFTVVTLYRFWPGSFGISATPTPSMAANNPTPTQVAFIAETASPTLSPAVSPTATVAPVTPTPGPTAMPQPTDTLTPDLAATDQAQATGQAIIALTRTASAATLTPIPPATTTPTPVPQPTATFTPLPTNTPMLQTGTTRTNPKDGAVYVWIPPGKFSMGSSDEDKLARSDEKPQHTVEVDGFWIMQSEVTNAQYKSCVNAGACTEPRSDRWKDDQYTNHPVVYVDWNQAKTYAEWVGGRLPTEAEWEYACRGTDGRIYPWGNQSRSADRLNFAGSDKFSTMPVGSYPPGVNGLYDMVGNVWEWTADWYDQTYYTNSLSSNPTGPERGQYHTLRGGSFGNHVVDYVRCAARFWNGGNEGSNDIGFRVISPGW
jgi:formylglycine-generating enzyme required for sulfatase activity